MAAVDWHASLVGLGAVLAGCGSLFSGLAAYKLAKRRDNEQEASSTDS